MKHAVAKSLMLLVAACLGVQLAHACWLCDSSGGYPCCNQPDLTYYNDCSTGCIPCDGCCCASLREDNKGGSTVKRMAWQGSTIGPEIDKSDHLKEFLAMADRGVFDGKRVYMHPDGTIAKGIMNLPVDHWKSFIQKVVMRGGQKDPRLDTKLQSEDTPQTILEIETKTGHKLVIHLIDESTMKKSQNQPQSKSQKPSIGDTL